MELKCNYKCSVTVQVTSRNSCLSLLNTESKSIVPSEVPTRIAVGVARPNAQGQETTYKWGQRLFLNKLSNYKHQHSCPA